jgi:hypothetical protein
MVSVKKDSEQRPPNAAKGNDSPAQTNAREFNASLGRQMQSPTISQSAPAGLAGDVIEGADAIAEFLFGCLGRKNIAAAYTIWRNPRGFRFFD